MTSDAGTPSPSPSPPKEHELSPRKQRRSPEGCEDEEDDREDRKRPRHRHHSDRHREEHETAAEDVSPIELPPPLPLPLSGQLKGDDDEREEGEILEDDEEGFGDFMKEELDNSESGEIKADKDDGGTDNLALASVNRVQTSPEGQYEVNAMSCDTEIVVEKHGFSDAAGKTLHKSGAKRMNGSIKSHDHATAEKYVKENSSVIEPDDKDKNLSSNDASRDRSKDDERCSKRKKREDQEDTVSDFESKRHRSHKQSESRDNHSRKRSVSRDSLKDRYKLREASPSYQKYYGESRLKEKSSRETRNEKNLSSGREKVRTTSDHEDLEYSKGDTDDHRNHTDSNEKEKQVRKERERSHSHSRHDSRGESHDRDKHISQGSRESDRYRDKDRSSRERDGERDRARLRDTNREKVKDDKREPDRSRDSGSRGDRGRSEERHAERRKSRDCDSHDRRSKYNDDREADRDRDRVEHRGRERSEGRHTERAKSRDRDSRDDSRHSKYYGERDTDRNKDRDRGGYREHDRSQGRRHGERGNSRDRDSYDGSRRSKYDDSEYHDDRLRDRKLGRHSKHSNQEADAKVKREEEEDYQDKVEEQLATQEDDDAEKILEESRRRRLAILEKYKQQQAQQQQASNSDNDQKENGYVAEDANKATEPSASAYPDGKMNDVDTSARMVSDQLFSIGKSPHENGKSVENAAPGGLGCGTPKGERSGDMFSDDIFGESPTGVRKMDKGENVVIERSGLHDNWDDAEGYYCYRLGEVLDGRYEVIAAHGKGVFSTVVRAKDLKAGKGDPEEVAIKIIRSNDTMYKAGMDELVILKKLAGADPENRRHCVRFLSSFKYRNHLCLVFESLHMNLREVLKKFGRNIGLKLTAVRTYAKQLFIALKHLKNCGVLHCDIKPDNMLVNDAKNVLKLCDFGNAMFAGKNEITPYLVSRFYRAPEIILGLAYDHPMDMWSVGCCLFELYNGKVLFPGPSNNDMLHLHMELKGPFPKKMLKKGLFTERHFDHDLNFHSAEEDPVTKKTLKRLLFNIRPKDIGTIFTTYPEEDPKMLGHFKDLLEKIFVLDPDKRLTVSQALSHPFITSK